MLPMPSFAKNVFKVLGALRKEFNFVPAHVASAISHARSNLVAESRRCRSVRSSSLSADKHLLRTGNRKNVILT